ncbi:MAG: hypothetical protein JWM20_806 [Patescibacteria group bacterium]|nr:hypothetical protein [Patescibacteria group bacterium]
MATNFELFGFSPEEAQMLEGKIAERVKQNDGVLSPMTAVINHPDSKVTLMGDKCEQGKPLVRISVTHHHDFGKVYLFIRSFGNYSIEHVVLNYFYPAEK